jgi:hypothetical protein
VDEALNVILWLLLKTRAQIVLTSDHTIQLHILKPACLIYRATESTFIVLRSAALTANEIEQILLLLCCFYSWADFL